LDTKEMFKNFSHLVSIFTGSIFLYSFARARVKVYTNKSYSQVGADNFIWWCLYLALC